IMRCPFADGLLGGGDTPFVAEIGRVRRRRGGAIIRDGLGEARLFGAVELLELAALLFPMVRLGLLDDQQDGEGEADSDAGDALRIEQAQDHSLSASTEAPSRLALSLNR